MFMFDVYIYIYIYIYINCICMCVCVRAHLVSFTEFKTAETNDRKYGNR